MEYVYLFGIVFATYLIGSFPTGYLLVKAVKGIDIRKEGSGSTGATNVKRILGKKGFFTVMFIDAMKGLLPVLAVKYLEIKYSIFPSLHILPVLSSAAIILGHSKSIFLGFTGGKSVASGAGTVMGLDWHAGMLTAVIWAVISYTSKYVSLASIVTLLLAPVWMWVFKQPLSYIIYCSVGAIYIVWLHRENISRLIQGKENKVR